MPRGTPILLAAALVVGLSAAAWVVWATGPGGLPDGPSALEDPTQPGLPDPLVDPVDLVSIPGGPGPDDIPAIDRPEFVAVTEADRYLRDPEPVVVVDIEDPARAYPVQILTWHEIVNDQVGGRPLVVTYCPLCNSAVSFERVVRGHEVDFGTSGRLYASALVMYDRATESLWTHFDGRAVAGVLTGARLEPIPSPLVAWSTFREHHPDGLILDRRRTGHHRPYGTNPYRGYDDPDGIPRYYQGPIDERLPRMTRVVGVAVGGEAVAWPLDAVREAGVIHQTMGGVPVVILWRPGQASALQETTVGAGRDVGTVGVFRAEAEGRPLTLDRRQDRFVDRQTGSSWSVLGESVAGPLEGAALERIPHLDTFWFAWAAYHPDTRLMGG